MEPLIPAFQFVRDVHVKVRNQNGGIDKLRQDYYMKKHTINIGYHKMKTLRYDANKKR